MVRSECAHKINFITPPEKSIPNGFLMLRHREQIQTITETIPLTELPYQYGTDTQLHT